MLTDPAGQQIVQAIVQQEQQQQGGQGGPQQGGAPQAQGGGQPGNQGFYGGTMGLSQNPNAGGSNGAGGSEMMSPGMAGQ